MKFIFAMIAFAMIGCNSTPNQKEKPAMPGAYNMLSQTVNDGKKDTTYTGLQQLKIYTEDHMMYANFNPSDSSSGFGIGSYTADTGTVTEYVFYSAGDTSINAEPATYTLLIEKTLAGYKQVIPEIGSPGNLVRLTEIYDLASVAVKSPLDGAWKLIKGYTLKGKDTIANTATQFKTYYAGHFLFGHTYADSTKKNHTGMGYGTFAMNGNNKVKENVAVSTYYQIRGQSFDIDIAINGPDEFRQTITDTNGDRNVEIYQRLKK